MVFQSVRFSVFLFLFLMIPTDFAFSFECEKGSVYVRSHHRSSYLRADGKVVKASFVRSYCRALSAASEFAQERIREGRPQRWPYDQEKTRRWSDFEKNRIRDVFEELPPELRIKSLVGIYRMEKSKDDPNPATRSSGEVVLYDRAFDAHQNLSRILAHELAHEIYESLSREEREEYRKVAEWVLELDKSRNVVFSLKRKGMVAEDSVHSRDEDFSNNLEYYLFEPDKLKKTSPGIFDWITKKMGSKFKLRK